MPITTQQIIAALSQVEDPDLKKDLVTLNMVKDIVIDKKNIHFTVVLTTPSCPLKDHIKNACITAIHHLVDNEAIVEVNMTAQVTSHKKSNELSNIKNIIAVASGKGGVGKSTVSTNLAIALSQAGSKVGLVDADIYGPSIPLMFGLENEKPFVELKDGKNIMLPHKKFGLELMSVGFLLDSSTAVVWRGPMVSKAFSQLIGDTQWGELDYLIVDLPPGTGDIHITIAQQWSLTGVVIVTTPQQVAVSDARKATAMFLSPQIHIPILGIVENMSYFTPPELPDKQYYIFGKGGGQSLATEFRVPLLVQIPINQTIREGSDRGTPISLEKNTPISSVFERLASSVAQQISIHNAKNSN